jgi:hypothetical protein
MAWGRELGAWGIEGRRRENGKGRTEQGKRSREKGDRKLEKGGNCFDSIVPSIFGIRIYL